ncbi:alpha/beta fold hydrolase [Caulobacter sp. NIBR2454]|uniref:alpha/beta fold hydrolase n=1 Tax=Caulobacter sp. NIBR2454 TaxID=3015996 RepID=UPI0022B6AB51|nr:alpha/beta fold hydrolase [Caulobacter sp. NIBR2454]
MSVRLALLISAAFLTVAGSAQALPRRAELGVTLGAAKDGGVTVDAIATPASAAAAGLQAGDVILSIGGAATASPAAVLSALEGRRQGQAVKITLRRGDKTLVQTRKLAPKAREQYDGGHATYGSVPFGGGQLADIMVAPPQGPAGPVLYIIQGYTCASMEASNPQSAYRLLAQGLLARGVSTYRVEKPGVGDSLGGPSCATIDFDTEVRAFEAGYNHLVKDLKISPERIFILGHSMGGVEAPLIAARNPSPRGVAVYGTVVRSWQDYLQDVFKYQAFLARGGDPARGEADGEATRGVIEKIYGQGATPAQVAATNAEDAKRLRDWFGWDGAEQIFSRHYSYWHGVAKVASLAAWRDVRSDVLSVRGESDLAALNDEDHKLIADVVSHYRPGTARFVSVPLTGHGMRIEGTPAQVRANAAAPPPAAFNPTIIDLFGDWIEAAMAKPPVATQFEKAPA